MRFTKKIFNDQDASDIVLYKMFAAKEMSF